MMQAWRTSRGYEAQWDSTRDLLVKGDVRCPFKLGARKEGGTRRVPGQRRTIGDVYQDSDGCFFAFTHFCSDARMVRAQGSLELCDGVSCCLGAHGCQANGCGLVLALWMGLPMDVLGCLFYLLSCCGAGQTSRCHRVSLVKHTGVTPTPRSSVSGTRLCSSVRVRATALWRTR